MVELNHRQRTIKIKIVYYGPPVGGKTTNLQVLHGNASLERRGEMVSINSAQDRTILFDLLPLRAAGFRGFEMRLQLLAVPGQAVYLATRRLVLKGADALVFVANSAADRWEENVQAFREMTDNLLAHQLDPASIPLVLQYNKRDLPEVTPIDFMDRTLNARKVPAIPAVAVKGDGVLETFAAVLRAAMEDLAVRYQIVDVGRGQPLESWTHNTLLSMFGSTSLAPEAEALREERPAILFSPRTPEAPSADTRTVRIVLPEEALRRASARPDARANETLVETYAEAGARLSMDLAEMREERDLTRRRLADVHLALTAARDLVGGQAADAAVRSVLEAMADTLGSRHATFAVPGGGPGLRTTAQRGLPQDPLLKVSLHSPRLLDALLSEREPRTLALAGLPEALQSLAESDPPLADAIVVPSRTPRGLRGIGLLYFTVDDARPKAEDLLHAGALASILAPALELLAAGGPVDNGPEFQRTLLGTASERGLEELLASVLVVRDRLGAVRRNPQAGQAVLDAIVRLTPALTGALSLARGLLLFGRGEIQREVVALDEVVAQLQAGGVNVRMDPSVPPVFGDLVLIRLAVQALMQHLRGEGSDPTQLAVSASGKEVRIRVGTTTVPAPRSNPSGTSLHLALARRIAELHASSVLLTRDAGGSWATLVLRAV